MTLESQRKSQEWALDKIKKCLAIFSKNTTNPHEAKAALRQAQKLMSKYSINMQDLELSDLKEEVIVVGKTRSNPPQWQTSLGNVCARAFNCRIIFSNKMYFKNYQAMNAKQMHFIGTKTGSELASYTFTVLKRQLNKDRKEYLKTIRHCKLETKRRRADLFANSWIRVVNKLIQQFAEYEPTVIRLINLFIAKTFECTEFEYEDKSFHKYDQSAIKAAVEAGAKVKLFHGLTTQKNEQASLNLKFQS